jgi:hypothetical protein
VNEEFTDVPFQLELLTENPSPGPSPKRSGEGSKYKESNLSSLPSPLRGGAGGGVFGEEFKLKRNIRKLLVQTAFTKRKQSGQRFVSILHLLRSTIL